MKFEVYDKKNPDRLLGAIHATLNRYVRHYEVPLYTMSACAFDAVYDPDEAPTFNRLVFDIEWKYEVEEVKQPTQWTKQEIKTSWAVMLTDAPLTDLLRCNNFEPAGQLRVAGDRFVLDH